MKLLYPIAALLCLMTARVLGQDHPIYQAKVFVRNGEQLPYRILYPRNYNKGKKYPVVLFLHGGGERGSDNEKQLTHGASLFIKPEVRKKYPAIVIFPQCAEDDYWASVAIDRSTKPITLEFDYSRPATKSLSLATALLDSIVATRGVDSKRVYVVGLSMGGMGTFELVHRNPKKIAAAVPICGGGDSIRYQPVKTSFWLFHGRNDSVVDYKNSVGMTRALKRNGINVQYTEYPNVDHNSWDNVFAEPMLLPWLFKQKR